MGTLLDTTRGYLNLVGRVLIAAVFVFSGLAKIRGYVATQAYMESAGVSGALLPFAILLELGGAIGIIVGLYTRAIALLLTGYCLLTAVLFHAEWHDQAQAYTFLKNVGLAGGFLFLAAHGAGRLSVDHMRRKSEAGIQRVRREPKPLPETS